MMGRWWCAAADGNVRTPARQPRPPSDGLGPNRRTDRGVVCSLFGSNDASSHRAQITHARRWLRGPIVGGDLADSDIGGVGVDE